jgi:hypothetical protein
MSLTWTWPTSTRSFSDTWSSNPKFSQTTRDSFRWFCYLPAWWFYCNDNVIFLFKFIRITLFNNISRCFSKVFFFHWFKFVISLKSVLIILYSYSDWPRGWNDLPRPFGTQECQEGSLPTAGRSQGRIETSGMFSQFNTCIINIINWNLNFRIVSFIIEVLIFFT